MICVGLAAVATVKPALSVDAFHTPGIVWDAHSLSVMGKLHVISVDLTILYLLCDGACVYPACVYLENTRSNTRSLEHASKGGT